MARKEIILSVYIATYNRKDIILSKLREFLIVKSNEFDIWVLDDSSSDGTFEELSQITDGRLHLIKNDERQGALENGAMTNWYRLLENVDGVFAFHLNDRDTFHIDELIPFIEYLKKHRESSGGLCDSFKGDQFFETPEEALLNIAYMGSHPTGIVFNMERYRSIENRKKLFTKQYSYIHPHDLVLGNLAQYGKMFNYHKIWDLAEKDSFTNNKSFLYKKGSAKNAWFAPQERMQEFNMFLDSLCLLNFSQAIKKHKANMIARSYLYYCTFNYAFYVSDPGQTSHYGIEPIKLRRGDLKKELYIFLKRSTGSLKDHNLLDSERKYHHEMISYFWKIYFGKPVWDFYKKVVHRKW